MDKSTSNKQNANCYISCYNLLKFFNIFQLLRFLECLKNCKNIKKLKTLIFFFVCIYICMYIFIVLLIALFSINSYLVNSHTDITKEREKCWFSNNPDRLNFPQSAGYSAFSLDTISFFFHFVLAIGEFCLLPRLKFLLLRYIFVLSVYNFFFTVMMVTIFIKHLTNSPTPSLYTSSSVIIQIYHLS